MCSEVEVVALLQYVVNQLKSSESLDLLVLKEMVQTMTVRTAAAQPSQSQAPAGPWLQRCRPRYWEALATLHLLQCSSAN